MVRFILFSLVLISLALAGPARALEDENLLVAIPKGYKIGFQNKTGQVTITEMVPTGETVQNWTEMVTVQVFLGLGSITPEQFRGRSEKLWAEACPGSEFGKVKEAIENQYPTLTWFQKCPQNKQTGKPELTWLKGMQGRDSFYLVQKAYKFKPTVEQSKPWDKYLDEVQVCDTRLPDRPCKAGLQSVSPRRGT